MDATAQPASTAPFLATYLRDHLAASSGGLALVQRIRRANAGTSLDELLRHLESEFVEERQALETIMGGLDVAPSAVKSAFAVVGEAVARLKVNGRVLSRSPSSTVVELEALAAAITTKRNLWRSLRVAASDHPSLHADQFEHLEEQASRQLERLAEPHMTAASVAFGAATRKPADAAT
jgi:hypothetical protein